MRLRRLFLLLLLISSSITTLFADVIVPAPEDTLVKRGLFLYSNSNNCKLRVVDSVFKKGLLLREKGRYYFYSGKVFNIYNTGVSYSALRKGDPILICKKKAFFLGEVLISNIISYNFHYRTMLTSSGLKLRYARGVPVENFFRKRAAIWINAYSGEVYRLEKTRGKIRGPLLPPWLIVQRNKILLGFRLEGSPLEVLTPGCMLKGTEVRCPAKQKTLTIRFLDCAWKYNLSHDTR